MRSSRRSKQRPYAFVGFRRNALDIGICVEIDDDYGDINNRQTYEQPHKRVYSKGYEGKQNGNDEDYDGRKHIKTDVFEIDDLRKPHFFQPVHQIRFRKGENSDEQYDENCGYVDARLPQHIYPQTQHNEQSGQHRVQNGCEYEFPNRATRYVAPYEKSYEDITRNEAEDPKDEEYDYARDERRRKHSDEFGYSRRECLEVGAEYGGKRVV